MDICVLLYRLSHYFQDEVTCRWTQSNWYSTTTHLIFLSRPDGLIPAVLSNVNKRNQSRNWWGSLRLWKIETHCANALCGSVERQKGTCLTKENKGTRESLPWVPRPKEDPSQMPQHWLNHQIDKCGNCLLLLSQHLLWQLPFFLHWAFSAKSFFFFLVVVRLFWPQLAGP